jgi:hypothetical protein
LLVGLVHGVPVKRDNKGTIFLDLQPKANGKLKENFHGGTPGNNLAELPQGEQKLGGVKFNIGAGLIQLGGKGQTPPDKVEGIQVGRAFARLHILHAAGTGWDSKDGTVIGHYVVHYADKTKAPIDIVYGKDVLDWWYIAKNANAKEAVRVAWKGNNESAKKSGGTIRLYLTTWKNPHPKKKVVSIDFTSTRATHAAPFCVAMTVEGK